MLFLALSSVSWSTARQMRDLNGSNFGIVIAYLIPGFVALFGVAEFSETVSSWLRSSPTNAPTVGGFLYITLGSLGAGLIVSTVRWCLVDAIHHRTGIPLPDRDFGHLQEKLEAYQYLVATHYNYYKCHANCGVAFVFLTVARMLVHGLVAWQLVLVTLLEVVLWLGARNNLSQYFDQGERLLRLQREQPATRNGEKQIESLHDAAVDSAHEEIRSLFWQGTDHNEQLTKCRSGAFRRERQSD